MDKIPIYKPNAPNTSEIAQKVNKIVDWINEMDEVLKQEPPIPKLTNEEEINKIIKLLEEIKANQPVPYYYYPPVYYPPCPPPYIPPYEPYVPYQPSTSGGTVKDKEGAT